MGERTKSVFGPSSQSQPAVRSSRGRTVVATRSVPATPRLSVPSGSGPKPAVLLSTLQTGDRGTATKIDNGPRREAPRYILPDRGGRPVHRHAGTSVRPEGTGTAGRRRTKRSRRSRRKQDYCGHDEQDAWSGHHRSITPGSLRTSRPRPPSRPGRRASVRSRRPLIRRRGAPCLDRGRLRPSHPPR